MWKNLPKIKNIIISQIFVLLLSKGVFAGDISFIVGGEINCLGKTNSHAIVGQTYNNREYILYSVYEREYPGSWMETSRQVSITEDSVNRPIIFIYETEKYASTSYELKSEEPLIYAASWKEMIRFCKDF